MNFPPTEKQLLQLLHESGISAPDKKISLHELPHNPARRDLANRRNYILYSGVDIIGFLTAGRNLRLLAERTELFNQTYPSLGIKVLGYTKSNLGELLLQKHFAGQPAHLLLGQPAEVENIRAILEKIGQTFDVAQRTSTPNAAKAELDAIFDEIVALPQWTTVDKVFLNEVVRPYLEAKLQTGRGWTRRVSNGDFLLRNLLINDSGEFRLIDCEFATDTHFHAEDWLRFTYWDALPHVLRSVAESRIPIRNPWIVFLSLKQLLLENRINTAQKAQQDANHWCREIRRIMEHDKSAPQLSCFWPPHSETASQISTEARLYWLADQGWSDKDSVSLVLEAGRPVQLVFDIPAEVVVHALRLDPMNGPGVATIHSMQVVLPDKGYQILWAGADPVALQQLVPGGDSLIDADPSSKAFRVISLENDPQLYLNGIGKTAGQLLQIQAIVTFSTDPLDQIGPVRRYVQLLLRQSQKNAAGSTPPETKFSHLEGRIDAFAEVTKTSLAKIADDSSTKDQVASLETRLAALAAQLHSAKADLAKIADDSPSRAQVEKLETQLVALAAQLNTLAGGLETGLSGLAAGFHKREALEQELSEVRKSLLLLQATTPERDRQLTLAREALQGHARTIDRLEQTRDKLEQALQASQASTLAQMESVRTSEDQNGRLAQELAATQAHAASLAEQLQRNETNQANLRDELTASAKSLESSRLKESQAVVRMEAALEELQRANASLTNHEKLLSHLNEQLASSTAEVRNFAAKLVAEEQRRAEMEQSRSWRWTAWIRRLSKH